MKIIDTHSHIYSEQFDDDIAGVIDRARGTGVEKILLPNIDVSSINSLHNLADRYPDYCIPMMGLHPTSVDADWQENLHYMKALFANRSYIAIGEIGIDLYWDKTFEEEQKQAFEEQLRWSIEYDLPVAIHSRDAIMECISCIKNVGADKLRGVFHSFGGSSTELQGILELGNFLLGINGVVTFKNSTLPSVLKETDLSQLIIETDAPYLAPMPYRGKRNEPAYTTYIAAKLAEIYEYPVNEVADVTTENAKKLFKLGK